MGNPQPPRPARHGTTSKVRSTTSKQVVRGGEGRLATGRRRPEARPSPLLWIVGGVAGFGLLIGVAIAWGGSNSVRSGEREAAPSAVPTRKPVDVRALVEGGERKCEEGLALIQSCKGEMDRGTLSPEASSALKEKLTRGVQLITAGSHDLDTASQQAGESVGNFKNEWGMARKLANNYIANLGK